jgi:predicted N-acetyltransferase YhbS
MGTPGIAAAPDVVGALVHEDTLIRKANEVDVPAVLECLQEAFEPYRDRYTLGAFLDTVPSPEDLRKRLASMCVFVATTQSGEIAGTIACNMVSSEEGHIRGMAVRAEWQGTDVAGQLIQSVETELQDQGCSRITLDTTAVLQRARRFYEKHGFRRSGRVADFFGMELIEYVKRLS